MTKTICLFSPGMNGQGYYRIPSVVRTRKGTLICAGDERIYSNADNPNRINKVLRRSLDGGQSWGPLLTAVRESGESQNTSSAAIDPALVVNEANGEILMIYCHTPPGIGLYNSIRSVGGLSDGKEIPTSYLMLTKSRDDGLTWTEPVCLNDAVKDPSWGFIGAGPGCGICIRAGKYAGRIVFPIYYSGNIRQPSLMACVIYSDDVGDTWTCGQSVLRYGEDQMTDGVMRSDEMQITECQVVEHGEGILHLYMRNHAACRRIARATSTDGGESWSDFRFLDDMPQPICQLSAIRFRYRDRVCVAIVNPSSGTAREHGTVRLSLDDGITFPYSLCFCPGPFLYNASVYLPETEEIGIAYEPTWDSINFVKLKIEDIISKGLDQ